MEHFAASLTDFVLRRPRTVIVATLVVAIALASGVLHLGFSNNYRAFFSPDNPDLVTFENFQATYTKNDSILFILQPQDGSVFDRETLTAIEELTEKAWTIPYAIRVDSVTNFQHSWADGDELTVEDLVADASSLPDEALTQKRAIALAEPLLRGNLISHDADTTGVNVTLQYPEESLMEVPEAAAAARRIADEIRATHPDIHIALSGVSMLNNAFAEAGMQDAMTLIPFMYLVLVTMTFIALRTVSGTFATVVVIGLSTASALGIGGFAGIKLTPISIMAPTIILTLAIADSVHILVTMMSFVREGKTKLEALRESMRVNFRAVFVTSVTTIVGFLSLNFSDAPPFWHLGNLTAMGIAAAFLYSVTFLPAFVAVLPLKARRASDRTRSTTWMDQLGDVVARRYRPILAIAAVVTISLTALVPTIDLNDEWVRYFDHRVAFRHDADFGIEHLNGIYLVDFSVEADGPGGISEPLYLERLEAFTEWLRSEPEVRHVVSYTDIIKRLNMNMHGDEAQWRRIPDERELAAQYLLLYELSLPFGLDLNDRVNIDKSATRITAALDQIPTGDVRELLDRSRAWLHANTPTYMRAQPTGATVMFSFISQRNIESMLGGNALAVFLIAAIMMVSLRSVSLGAMSLIPNAVPILMTFGVWALLVGEVGMAAATVSATSLGIVVDSTVHFLTKYLRARRELGLDAPDAVRYTYRTVGVAILANTLIFAFGFSVLAASTFRINSQMGLLTAIAIVIAVVVDFLLLPAVLLAGQELTQKEAWTMNFKPLRTLVRLLVPGALALVVTFRVASDGTSEEKGYQLAAVSDRSDRGFGDSAVELEMILRNKAGKESRRRLSIKTLEVPDESVGDKSLIVFDSPRDIDGTALLSHSKILDADDQWLYLPALKRVKRISSVNKSGPFVGSELAFEDFTALELEKFDYDYVRSEPCGDLECDVVERYPRYEHSGYTRQVSWIDQDVSQIRKIEFYDRKDALLKTLSLHDYRLYDGKYWRPQTLSIVNHQTGKSTELVYSEYTFRTGLKDGDFVKSSLRRIR